MPLTRAVHRVAGGLRSWAARLPGALDELLALLPVGRADRWTTAAMLAFSAVALGHAIAINYGRLHVEGIAWLTVAFGACIAGVWLSRGGRSDSLGENAVVLVLAIGIVWHVIDLATGPRLPLPDRLSPAQRTLYLAGVGTAGLLAALTLLPSALLRRAAMPLLLVTHLALGAWAIGVHPSPTIDVFMFQRDSSRALLSGTNPYAITFPDPFGPNSWRFYGPGISVDGRLTFGFPYPPLSLFLVLPGELLGGDVRYSHLAAVTLSGALIAYARPGRVASGAAAVFLLTPSFFYMLTRSWTESFVVLLLAATAFFACRLPKATALAFGLFLAVKQYLVFAAPLALLLTRPRRADASRFLVKAGLVALLVTVPLMLWDLRAFIYDVLIVQFRQPFRPDSLGYAAWLVQQGMPQLPGWLPFLAPIPLLALSLWRAAPTPAGFAAAVALVFFPFFAFNKQAFGNYYFFVLGALCCAVAVSLPRRETGEVPQRVEDTG